MRKPWKWLHHIWYLIISWLEENTQSCFYICPAFQKYFLNLSDYHLGDSQPSGRHFSLLSLLKCICSTLNNAFEICTKTLFFFLFDYIASATTPYVFSRLPLTENVIEILCVNIFLSCSQFYPFYCLFI